MPDQQYIEIARQSILGILRSNRDMTPLEIGEICCVSMACWIEESARHLNNVEFYRGLIDQCVDRLPEPIRAKAFIADDGTVQDSPLRLKLPDLISEISSLVFSNATKVIPN